MTPQDRKAAIAPFREKTDAAWTTLIACRETLEVIQQQWTRARSQSEAIAIRSIMEMAEAQVELAHEDYVKANAEYVAALKTMDSYLK